MIAAISGLVIILSCALTQVVHGYQTDIHHLQDTVKTQEKTISELEKHQVKPRKHLDGVVVSDLSHKS